MTTTEITTPTFKSAAFAALTAYLIHPVQYAVIMAESVISMNTQCPLTVYRIDK